MSADCSVTWCYGNIPKKTFGVTESSIINVEEEYPFNLFGGNTLSSSSESVDSKKDLLDSEEEKAVKEYMESPIPDSDPIPKFYDIVVPGVKTEESSKEIDSNEVEMLKIHITTLEDELSLTTCKLAERDLTIKEKNHAGIALSLRLRIIRKVFYDAWGSILKKGKEGLLTKSDASRIINSAYVDALNKMKTTKELRALAHFQQLIRPTFSRDSQDEETTEDAVNEESDKREVVYRRTVETYPRTTPITASPTTTTTQHHYHRHHHHHHHNNSNHGSSVATSPPPPPPPPTRTTPSSPAHAVTPPAVGVRASGGPLSVSTVQNQQQQQQHHHHQHQQHHHHQQQQQQTSPRTSVSYPVSPASSPPRVMLIPRGSSSPLGLLSALSQDSSSPPIGGGTSDPGLSKLPHEGLHPHLNNGIRHNGLTKSLSLSPPSHNYTHHNLYSPEDSSFKDEKKRSGSTPSREVHNKLEKNRRAHLKECFEVLRRQLPSMDDKKISNQTILKAAHRHIQTLKRKEREYEHEMERLAREKIAHQQKLSALKKELSARWDHIDFNTLLPDMASLEQQRDKETKSTTTASEQPDLEEDIPRGDVTPVHVSPPTAAPCPLSPRLPGNQPQGTNFTTIATNSSSTIGATGLATLREHFTDSNQPLNLSTSIVDTAKVSQSGQTLVTHSTVSLQQNGEWGTGQASPQYTQAQYHTNEEEAWPTTVVTTVTPTATGDTATSVHSEQHLPIVGSTGGIHLPAQLVAGGMQLNGAPGGLLGQPAIQVITPEGYKLLPADHAPNGAKPLTITLAHPADGLERADNAEEVKNSPGAMMVALNKNGVSALHLAVPTTARSLPHSQGTNGTITTVPLNLSVGGTATVKVTSAATSSLIPSYIPITHANGITQLVSGLGSSVGTLVSGIGTPLVTPLVVSQPQRPVVPGSVASTAGSKGLKATAVAGSTNSVPLVPAQYASSLAGGALGGLVKPVVVVSAPTAVAGMVTGAPAGTTGKP